MSRCVCDGANENCRYCGGPGMIADRLGAALDDRLSRVALENSRTEYIKVPPERRSSTSSTTLPPPIRWIKCPQGCGSRVNPKKMKRHILRFHTGASGLSGQPRTAVRRNQAH
jgi:hypothetical protein